MARLILVAALALVLLRIVALLRPLDVLAVRRLTRHLRADARGISVGSGDVIAWSEVDEIRVETTDTGPLEDDVSIVLIVAGRKPTSIPEPLIPVILDQLMPLPEFDAETFAQAMGCVERASFTCWRGGSST